MSDRCCGNEEKNAFVADVVMSSNLPNPFCNSYLGFGLNLSGHVEGSGAADVKHGTNDSDSTSDGRS